MNEDLGSIMQKLRQSTESYPAAQIIGELTIVTERLGFAQFESTSIKDTAEMDANLGFLLGHDVSPGILSFVEFLAHNQKLGILLREAGSMFIAYCKTYFAEMKQLTFKTAISMRPEKCQEVKVALLGLYPINTRIIFAVDPAIVAGFVIEEGNTEICNYSLRKRMIKLIDSYTRSHLQSWNLVPNQ